MAHKFTALALAIGDPKPALMKVGLVGKEIYATERKRKVSGSTPISSKVKERFDLRPREVVIRYTGPAHLLNNPTSPHLIAPRGSARGRRGRGSGRGRRALNIEGNIRAYANHPGTKGLNFHAAAVRKAKKELPKVYRRAGVTEPIRKAFAA